MIIVFLEGIILLSVAALIWYTYRIPIEQGIELVNNTSPGAIPAFDIQFMEGTTRYMLAFVLIGVLWYWYVQGQKTDTVARL